MIDSEEHVRVLNSFWESKIHIQKKERNTHSSNISNHTNNNNNLNNNNIKTKKDNNNSNHTTDPIDDTHENNNDDDSHSDHTTEGEGEGEEEKEKPIPPIQVCIDVDMSYRIFNGRIHLGAHRYSKYIYIYLLSFAIYIIYSSVSNSISIYVLIQFISLSYLDRLSIRWKSSKQ